MSNQTTTNPVDAVVPGDPVLVSDNGKRWYPGILHELRPGEKYSAICRVIADNGELVDTELWRMWKPWAGVTPGY